MKDSTFSIITELCSTIIQQDSESHLDKKKLVKLRSKAFEVLLNNNKSCILEADESEDDLSMILVDIRGYVYFNSNKQGLWCLESKDTVDRITDELETLATRDPVIYPVLRLLLALADTNLTTSHWQEPSYGWDMKTLISNKFKHRALVNGQPSLQSSIFEFPLALKLSTDDFQSSHQFDDTPGSGLRYQEFFSFTTLKDNFISNSLRNIDQHDISNGNLIFPKLSPTPTGLTNTSQGRIQDEGYVTPDQEINLNCETNLIDYQWELVSEEKFNPVYSWESFGSPVINKEPPFILQGREIGDHVWRVIHSFSLNTTLETDKSEPVVLTTVGLEALELGFKNLLIGVQSTTFYYNIVSKTFALKKGLHLQNSSAQTLEEYCKDFIECANLYCDLTSATQEFNNSSSATCYGLIYQVLCSNIRCYLQCYRGIVLRMPSPKCLLQTHLWLYKLRTQLQFLVDLVHADMVPKGSALLAHIYDQLSLVTRPDLTHLLYYILQSCTKVYFELLKKWIFEGECDNLRNELFIEANPVEEFDRRFWSRGFTLNKLLVPGFLKELEGDIFMCGKNMALLQICAPDDPVCVAVKRGYPALAVCLNKTHINRTEALFHQYRKGYTALCHQVLGKEILEPHHSDNYYASLRAATLKKICEAQEEEKKLLNDKKRLEFEILKKNMEEAKSRIEEDKLKVLQEEKKLLKEAQEVDKLNELRIQEEKKKLQDYYSALSNAADKRRERAEWKINRVKLQEKRVEFFKTSLYTEDLIDSNEHGRPNNTLPWAKGSEDTFCNVNEIEAQVTTDEGSKRHNICNVVTDEVECSETTINQNAEHAISGNLVLQEWSIGLDFAKQARQSAAKFKERNMFNDYNILTGEVESYENRFKKKIVHGTSGSPDKVSLSRETEGTGYHEINDDTQPDLTDNATFKPSEFKEVLSSNNNSCDDLSSRDVSKYVESKIITSPVNDSSQLNSSSHVNTDVTFSKLFDFENDIDVAEINIMGIDQNLRMSVMIPLQTQLDISNDAVLRLLLVKHSLFKHLECIKSYFFLEGEFGSNLTRELFTEIQTVVKNGNDPSYVLNVPRMNSLLRSSIGTSSDEEFTERLSFYVKKVPSVFRLIDPNMLECLSMRYKTFWPMNIIVTDGSVLKLDIVFTFFVKMHRVSWVLEETIYLLKDRRLNGSKQFKEIQLFRHIMTHFVNSLKIYVTTTVECCWFEFKGNFKAVRTLNDIYNLYVKYINTVRFRCLLNKKAQPMGSHLNKVFGQILRFYEGLRNGVWALDTATGQFCHSSYRSLAHVYCCFLKEACYIYRYTRACVQSAYDPQLGHLHSLLSANNFYSRC